MFARGTASAIVCAVALLAAPASSAWTTDLPSNVRPLEPGFVVQPYGVPTEPTLLTSVAVGPNTLEDADGEVLYAADYLNGRIYVMPLEDGAHAYGATFADGFNSPLGVAAARDGSVYVADSEPARNGPFGLRVYGRVWKVQDRDGDGSAERKHVVLKDLPNGRHNTNNLELGPDGMLYVTNGNSTDDGVEGGQSEVVPWSGSVVRVDPNARGVSIAKLGRKALVAHGWRNVYDLAFSPIDRTKLFIPMNGADDARRGSTGENPLDPNIEDSDDLLYVTDINDRRVDDFGFPECLYNVAKRGNLEPYENPNPDVVDRFGKCNVKRVPRPIASFGLHPSTNGLAFQTTGAWGHDYRNDLFVAEWGQLFGPPAGHKVVRVELDDSGKEVVGQSDFLELDLPLDVDFDTEGSLYVADFSGTIFKVFRVP